MSPLPNKNILKEQERVERARVIAALREQVRKAEEKGDFNSAHHQVLANYLHQESAAAAPQEPADAGLGDHNG
jgi:hypothetical protein